MEIPQQEIQGYVLSGRGKASQQIQDEYQSFFEATGEDIILGSLNVILEGPVFFDTTIAKKASDGRRLLWKAYLFDQPVWVYRFPHAPMQVAEIISSVHLRDMFDLADGDKVSINVPKSSLVDLTVRQRLAWSFLWRGRESWSYDNDRYYFIIKDLSVDLGATQLASHKSVFKSFIRFIKRQFR